MRCQLSTVERKSDGTGSASAILTLLTHTDEKSFETCQASTKLASFSAEFHMSYIDPKTPHDFPHIPNVRFVVRLATLCNAILLLYVRYVRFPGKSSREAEVRFPPPDRASERFSCDCASLPGRTLAARRQRRDAAYHFRNSRFISSTRNGLHNWPSGSC